MSNYTTELRFICETMAGKPKSEGYNSIAEIIQQAHKKIFSFPYPIFDENYRTPLETKIIRHFYTREICEETVGLWQLRLEARLNEIMPYYNKLYESELLKFNPFYDIDYTLDHKGRANESKKQTNTQDTTQNTDFDEGVDKTAHSVTTDTIDDLRHIASNEINNTTGNVVSDHTAHTDTGENVHSTTVTTDNTETLISDVTNRDLDRELTIADSENTKTKENETSNTYTQKLGDNDTNLTDSGRDVDTTVYDGTKVRTPNLTTDKKTDDTTKDTGTVADNRNIAKSVNKTTDETNNGTENYLGTKNTSENSLDLFSDTPQGNLEYPNQGTTQDGGSIALSPDVDFPRADGQPYDPDRDYSRVLRARLNSRYLTNGRDIEAVNNQLEGHQQVTSTALHSYEDLDETTDDDVTHTRNYQNQLDGHTVTKETGNENTKTDDNTTLTKVISETHNTHYDIDETTDTDFTDEKTGNKDFTKSETDNTDENEHTTYNSTKNENETINSVTDTSLDRDVDLTEHTNTDSTKDFTGSKDTNDKYDRNRVTDNTSVANQKTLSNKKFLEALTGEVNYNIRDMDEYLNHAVGKISDTTYSKMLLEFRETFINIDNMIIEELNDLFFMLY